MTDRDSLIHDWNLADGPPPRPSHAIEFDDETLRDGLQSPSVTDPPIEKKIEILHLMERLGIQTADIGLPAAGPRARADVKRLAEEIVRSKLRIGANCAARTKPEDIDPIADVSQAVGIPIEACTFLGSSPIRMYTEGWTVDQLLQLTETAVRYGVSKGLPVMMVTEDSTRAHPETLRRIYTTAIECGAKRVCVADTTGHATPEGTAALIRFILGVVADTGEDVKVDWHGHNDRGLGTVNCIAAAAAGAHRIHGTALGVGERVGNAALDQVLVNFKLLGWIDNDLSALGQYCETVSRSTDVPIPVSYPVVGRDAFRTATGVHAAAVIKAARKGDTWLTDAIYSGVPAGMFGLEQVIEIGPMSGASNVSFWLEKRGYPANDELVQAIFGEAKSAARVLTDAEVHAICRTKGVKAGA
ncbi:MAG TPA: LeuA family protein [Candidatus Eisenbacteria bacterium]